MLSGNHDHGLVAGWIDGRLLTEPSGFLGLEQRIEPRDAGPLAAALAERAAPARVRARLSRRLAARRRVRDPRPLLRPAHDRADVRAPGRRRDGALGRPDARRRRTPDDYEAALAPLYAWMHALTQRTERTRCVSAGAGASARAWVAMGGRGHGAGARSARRLLGGGFRAAVAAINALGLGPVEPDLTGPGLRRGYLRGIREVLRRLGVRRAARGLGPLAPLGSLAARRSRRVDHARGRTDPQHRLVGLPAALPHRRTERVARTGRAPPS